VNDIVVHLLLFTLIAAAIVTCGAYYGEPDDAKALRSVPRRLLWFFGGCAILVAIVLVIEHTVARVG
jgi:hypothetical protein